MTPPKEPEVFLKAMTSLTGPNDPISRGPNPGTKLDWEVELAIVGRARNTRHHGRPGAGPYLRLCLLQRCVQPDHAG